MFDEELEKAKDITKNKILAGSNPNLESERNKKIEIDIHPHTIKDAVSFIQTIQHFITLIEIGPNIFYFITFGNHY